MVPPTHLPPEPRDASGTVAPAQWLMVAARLEREFSLGVEFAAAERQAPAEDSVMQPEARPALADSRRPVLDSVQRSREDCSAAALYSPAGAVPEKQG